MGLFRRNKEGNGGGKRFTRIFFATDLHGSDDCFRKLISAATVYKADALVVGGDITGKQMVPIVRQPDGSYTCTFLGREQRLASEEEVQRLRTLITRAGNYTYVTDTDEVAELSGAPERVNELMHRLVCERVKEWVEFADEKLAGTGVPLYMCGGNDDFFEIDAILDAGESVVNHNGKVVQVDEHHEMMALGYANPTPWHCPRDITEDELGQKLDALAGQVQDVERSIFCLHVPPVDSTLDTCPRLDDSVYPPRVVSDGAGAPLMYGAGSTAVRAGIERFQPLLSLHGHIHESRGVTQIGRTTAINPGSEYGEGILRAALVNLTPDGILSHQLIAG